MSRIVDPRMMNALSGMFPSSCTIQAPTHVTDDYGTPETTWTTLYTNLPCQVAPLVVENVRALERIDGDKTLRLTPHRIALKGYFPAVTSEMRAVVGGQTWAIQGVEHDSQHTYTRLTVLEAQ